MKKLSKGLFQELLSLPINDDEEEEVDEHNLELDNIELEKTPDDGPKVDVGGESANISVVGNPVYPRIFWGDSVKPHSGQGPYPESSYVGDNIHTTYQGLLSYLG